jgi:uroporphyrinogen-III synthase
MIVMSGNANRKPHLCSNQNVPPRILITRAPHQSSALAEQLIAHGCDPILIPAIEIVDPTSFAALDAALAHLETFHWLLFTSANAVEAFSNRLATLKGTDVSSLAALKGTGFSPSINDLSREGALAPEGTSSASCHIAAIGQATARAAEAHNLPVTLIPPQAVAESLAEALLPHTHQPDRTPTRFLLIRAEQARDHLPDTLRSAGADVTIAPAYRTIIPNSSIEALRTLFSPAGRAVHAITFTSSSSATNLLALLEASGLTLPPEIPRISIGPITTQTLRDLNLPPHSEAAEPTIPALVASVVQFLAPKPSSL